MVTYDSILIIGPTASGKTKAAVELADHLNKSIISLDSRQVYRRMDIGTGKDLDEYIVDDRTVPHHLIDIAEPGEKYTLDRFKKDFDSVFEKTACPIICGGTGLYMKAILEKNENIFVPVNEAVLAEAKSMSDDELRKEITASRFGAVIDISSRKRMERGLQIIRYRESHPDESTDYLTVNPVIFALNPPTEIRRERISRRLRERLNEGMIEEVQALLDENIAPADLMYYGLEYKLVTQHILGELSLEKMTDLLETAIHQFAKRQMTWLRKLEREGHQINWLDHTKPTLDQFLEKL